MIWNISTAATTYGITVQEAKDHLRIFDTSWDTQITQAVKSANEQLFRWAGVLAGNAVLAGYASGWSTDWKLPFEKVASVTSVKYYDTDNAQQTLSAGTDYNAYLSAYPSVIHMENEPSLYDRPDAIEIKITMGYTVVPEAVKMALLLMVKDLFDVPPENYKGDMRSHFSRNTLQAIALISRRDEI